MYQGEIVGELTDNEANEEIVMQYATGTKRDKRYLKTLM